MVNVKNLFGMAVMATALVGCSSNDNLAPDGKDNAGKAGTAYAKFTIQLPTTNGTRTDGDPTPGTPSFEGGTANEYAVKDAQLVIFQKSGDSEGNYKFVETVNIGNLEPWSNQTPANQGVTRYANITAQLKGVSLDKTGNEYFALVILNNLDNKGVSKVTLPTTKGTTYSAWNDANNADGAAFLNSDNGFYMANAPLYSTGEPTTLVPIKGVYSTKAEAQTNPATTVYVERGMAKVTVNGSDFTINDASSTYNTDKVTINNWTLDVLNKSTFPVHVTTGLKTDFYAIWTTPRFVATSTPQRVYWGKDPNYDKSTLTTVSACQDEFYIVDNNGKTYNGDPSSTFTWSANTTPLYCLENTFDLDNMKQGQTTRVVFKATYTPHNLNGTDKTFFMIGNNTQIWTKDALVAQITSKAKEMLKSEAVVVTINAKAPLLKGGSHLLSAADVTIKDGEVDKTETFEFATLNTMLGLDNTEKDANNNPKVGIKTYENGECYYIARIKHFNELTPWPSISGSRETYGTNNEAFLGRYGVLRNNWYELTVSKVSAPGYPDVPEVKPETADDEDTKYINVEVKILDWAKRSQQVEL